MVVKPDLAQLDHLKNVKILKILVETPLSFLFLHNTGITRFTLLMWGQIEKKTKTERENRISQGYLVVLKGRKIV